MMPRWVVVRALDTGEIVHRIDVTSKTDSQVERVMEGMLMQMDTDRFAVADTKDD